MKRKLTPKEWVRTIGILVFLLVGLFTYLYTEGYFASGVPDGVNEIHFIDCGQGDSTLIISDGVTTLIDASTADGGEAVAAYLRELGVKKVDHFWISHPHDDHMGGAKQIVTDFQVGEIYLRVPTKGTEPTARFYLEFLKAVKEKGLSINSVEVGDKVTCGGFVFSVLGPVEDYEDLNDQSIIMRGQCGRSSVLFTGDQERGAEKDLVAACGDLLSSSLLKVGHHGSSGSSSPAFLDAVSPEYAVISCGEGNSYGHPHKEALKRLEEREIMVFRTDLAGTIVFTVDDSGVHLKEQ